MHLTGIKLGGIPPFTDPITLRFDERVNVFIGPNASGKSMLLLALENHFIGISESSKRPVARGRLHLSLCDNESFNRYIGSEDPNWSTRNYLSADEEWVGTREERIRNLKALPVIVIGSVREGLPGISNQPDLKDFGKTTEEVLAGPFSGSRTMCAVDLLGTELWGLESDDPRSMGRVTLMEAIELADACSKRICDEVVLDTKTRNYIPDPYVLGYLHHPQAADPNNIIILRSAGINTTDIRNFDNLPLDEQPAASAYTDYDEPLPIYLGHLSSGTEGTLLWIRWLALKMMHHYDFERPSENFDGFRVNRTGGWDKKPAILLIDEIENHLHPTWQRRVIPALLDHFPGLQIFATTHSPFVVAGLKAGQVHVLNRDTNGVVTASTNERDVIGWTADEILRGMMGVDEPTDQLTVDRANRLRQLREKDELNEQEEEELNRLRRQVNEDLLNKRGPLEAQRERYADLVQDFLRMRQSELTQDGE